ncbi:MAG: choice-of-anchor I domain-containing protein [Lentimonas sp.]
MKTKLYLTIALTGAAATAGHAFVIESALLTGEGSGEVVSYAGGTLAFTNNPAGGASLVQIGNDYSFNDQVNVDFSGYDYSGGFTFDSVTSVGYDARGFGFAAIQGSNGTQGRLGLFNSAGAILGTYAVGNNPDMVKIAGDRVFIANEGEFGASDDFTGAADTAGSVSYYSFNGATNAAGVFSSLSGETQIGFSSYTDAALDSAGIRRHANDYAVNESYKNLEPEYIAVSGDKAFVTLQENNAIAIVDLNSNTVDNIVDLGTHVVTVDASDKNDIAIDDKVKGMVMPDSIEVFETDGKTYVIVASEGDARGDDADIFDDRVGSSIADGGVVPDLENGEVAAPGDSNADGIDDAFASNNPNDLTISLDDNDGLGRAKAILKSSDTDGDGDLDDIIMLSDRGVTVYEYTGGTLVEADHLEGIEVFLAAQDPTRHNSNDGGLEDEFDKRSDDKGPELEALAVTEIEGAIIAAVAAERQGGIVLLDISDPTNTSILSDFYVNGEPDSLISPETMQFIEVNGETVLLVGFEGESGVSGGLGIYSIDTSLIPEPSTYAAILGLTVLGFAASRRRSRS